MWCFLSSTSKLLVYFEAVTKYLQPLHMTRNSNGRMARSIRMRHLTIELRRALDSLTRASHQDVSNKVKIGEQALELAL